MSIENRFVDVVLQAWRGTLDVQQLLEAASQLESAQLKPLVAVLYQTWLQRNGSSPAAHAIQFNLGVSLSNQGERAGAEEAYRRAIAMVPDFLQPQANLSFLLEQSGRVEEAIETWRKLVGLANPADGDSRQMLVMALNNLGRIYEQRRDYLQAEIHLTHSLRLDPSQDDALHHWVFLRQRQCAWPIYTQVSGVDSELMRHSTSALAMLNLSDDPQDQLEAAMRFSNIKVHRDLPALAPRNGYGHSRLRIAYCSSDFCLHPVSMLTVELFELHDREHFEVYGFCWSPEDGSALRQRVINGMDHFIRIAGMGDEEAARLIREHEIDILVDLQGQTAGARPNMLACRPAPIQITYLGQPATTALPSVDYVIADRFLIPEESARFYTEKPIYMPDVYQVSDRKRVAGPTPTRASCGLPEAGFVFCSFNNNYKITPDLFDVWMRLLLRVERSVLWLMSDNPTSQANLLREAVSRGVAPERIVFASRVSPENYLARYAIADLFLDTFPFNAGTTANDALWMGLPILTCSGRSFASRMAGALLTAAGLPELITYDFTAYEEKAVELALSQQACPLLRSRLKQIREQGRLFDTPRFVRELEGKLLLLAQSQVS